MNRKPIEGFSSLEKELCQGLQELKLEHGQGVLTPLINYLRLLNKWNSSFNLSGVTDIQSMVSLHLLDSLSLHHHLQGNTIVDIGTGAGLPGIPLAIVNPDKHFILIDSNGKKTRFLLQAKIELNLRNVAIENCRVEHYQSHRQIDMVICRAFSSLEDIADKSAQLMSGDSKLLAMKGRYPEHELNSLPKGFEVLKVTKLQIPGNESERHLIEIVRI